MLPHFAFRADDIGGQMLPNVKDTLRVKCGNAFALWMRAS